MNMRANYKKKKKKKKKKRSILTDKFLLETKLSSDLILSGFKKSSLLWTKFEDSVWLPSPTAGACPKQRYNNSTTNNNSGYLECLTRTGPKQLHIF